ncbi:hypothetical protein Ancab_037985 [Ancistrocladus abbreviatus]
MIMACSPMTMSTSPVAALSKDVFGEYCGLRHSASVKELYKQATRMQMRKSFSENNLPSYNKIQATSTQPQLKNNHSIGIFSFRLDTAILPGPIRSLLFNTEASSEIEPVDDLIDSELETELEKNENSKRPNWVERLMELHLRWMDGQEKVTANEYEVREGGDEDIGDGNEDGCEVDYDEQEEEERATIDSESFSGLLGRATWSDAIRFSKLAFLCNMAYAIPEIKARDLRRYYGLRFLTSSLEKTAEAIELKAKLSKDSTNLQDPGLATKESSTKNPDEKQRHLISPSVAYEIAASAASHVHSQAKRENPNLCGSSDQRKETVVTSESEVCNSEVAAHMAASTMTAVVAAEKEKQEAAEELQSLLSSPCEWFICDDPDTRTRSFAIQGSESLASWQANLFFEPTKFEGTEVLVHRGIYEAAKEIYNQFMPEIQEHILAYGDEAKLQFTGHSLGGSLCLLVHLMLVARKAVKPSTLLPVATFGSPFVFCGGRKVLDELGLDESHVHCVIMHRDIVPRAFSCNYPDHVAHILRRLNGSFRSHPCLNKHKLLYSPLGQIFILQPDEKLSPSHPLLPVGSALYALDKTRSNSVESALRTFLNTPHPLETLSDPTAYGSEGSIIRDHDSSNYLKAVNGVLRQYTKMVVRKVRKERHLIWPILTSPPRHSSGHGVGGNSQARPTRKEILTGV